MEHYKRTHTCGELREADEGKSAVLNGWVDRVRNLGGIFFISLRDRYGITQVVVDEDSGAEALAQAAELHNEYCIAAAGTVRARPEGMRNAEIATGGIELYANALSILNRCAPLPFQLGEESPAKEELRLRYRYLDLRQPRMQRLIKLRNDVSFATREFMEAEGFLEIETPTLIKSTPEGARDYLVPSRLSPGHFYALPQSPQLYKQLLMAAGFDKYFQIARCYRDEDARGDRQPEFTQIDIEMSFVSRNDVLTLTERLMGYIFKKTLGLELPAVFRRLTYAESIDTYGTDKPDLRFELPLRDFNSFAAESGFRAFTTALEAGGTVKALTVPGGAAFSRKQIEELEAHAMIYKAKGLAWMKAGADENGTLKLEGGAAKFFDTKADNICKALDAKPGDIILMCTDSNRQTACVSLGAVRSKLGKDLYLTADNGAAQRFEFVWVVDFPLFEWNSDENRWEAAHHLFSYPQERFHASMESEPGAVLGDLYDLVLNGYELASGSIRIHDPELQKRVFAIAGFSDKEAEERFGFLTGAFKYGAPPHGGIAPGLDRLVMLMAGETSIKEVIAFPKNSFAEGLMDGCPARVNEKQLAELYLRTQTPPGTH
ncbi:MAG: aspartate--tRNA ligase [Spirochaetaceae bacterium]|jgi:aspartyl-tRNA synthetase|nr:aspartate--tRNA ligase [Spirochaetaceae bacterium]